MIEPIPNATIYERYPSKFDNNITRIRVILTIDGKQHKQMKTYVGKLEPEELDAYIAAEFILYPGDCITVDTLTYYRYHKLITVTKKYSK